MLISHTHRFLFVHIYKNAGSAISEALAPWASHSVADLPYHLTAREIAAELGHSEYPVLQAAPSSWSDYHSFAVVRNPYDWTVSLYHWLLQSPTHGYSRFIQDLGSFSVFVEWLSASEAREPDTPDGRRSLYRRPQIDFLCDARGRFLVRSLLRFERLSEDFQQLCDELNLPATLTHSNESIHPPWQECYDDLTRKRVARLYCRDFQRLGYLR